MREQKDMEGALLEKLAMGIHFKKFFLQKHHIHLFRFYFLKNSSIRKVL